MNDIISNRFLQFLNKNDVIEFNNTFNFNKINNIRQLNILANFLLETILENNIPIHECDCIYSTAYKGVNILIPLSIVMINTFSKKDIKIGYVTKSGDNYVGYELKGNENIMLIDDVFNTGATLNNLLKYVKNKGIEKPLVSLVAIFNGNEILKNSYETESNSKLCEVYSHKK
jgi:orotate phosphoribosyltransferase